MAHFLSQPLTLPQKWYFLMGGKTLYFSPTSDQFAQATVSPEFPQTRRAAERVTRTAHCALGRAMWCFSSGKQKLISTKKLLGRGRNPTV